MWVCGCLLIKTFFLHYKFLRKYLVCIWKSVCVCLSNCMSACTPVCVCMSVLKAKPCRQLLNHA